MKSKPFTAGSLLGIFMIGVFVNRPAPAAEEANAEPAAEQQADASFALLPAPLDQISGNVADLQTSGHFEIVEAHIGRTRLFQDEALIWTLNVTRPLAARHAQILFRRVADVRFYRIEDDKQWRRQVHATHLQYPPWIDSAAANRESLNRDERFEVWLPLNAAKVDLLQQRKANMVVFSHQDHRTVVELTEPEHKFAVPRTKS